MDTGIYPKLELAGGFCDSVPPAIQSLAAPNNRVAAVACLDFGLDVHGSAPWFLSRVTKSVCRVARYSSPQIISRRTFVTSPPVPSQLLSPLGCTLDPRTNAVGRQRINQHPLRTTDGANGLQAVVTNPVVDGPPRDAEQFGRVVQRNAATDMWFELALGVGGHPGSFDRICKGTAGATPVKVVNATVKLLCLLKLCRHGAGREHLSDGGLRGRKLTILKKPADGSDFLHGKFN